MLIGQSPRYRGLQLESHPLIQQGEYVTTYNNADEVRELARKHGFMAKPIPMKNTHHAAMTELVIGRDLAWMNGIDRVVETQAEYKRRTEK